MTERISFLREQTITGTNKCMRTAMPDHWDTSREPYSIPVRKALALKLFFDNMPLFIGEQELIVGTRTLYGRRDDNPDGERVTGYHIKCMVPYLRTEEVKDFQENQSYFNKTHYTPDFSILLSKGIGGILEEVCERRKDPQLRQNQLDFLESVQIVYSGLSNLILRYADHASELAAAATALDEKERLLEISRICRKLSTQRPDSFREAVQLLWFGHLGTILESFEFISYGRLDVILGKYLKDTSHEEAEELLCCLLLKMYDQADLEHDYLGEYAAQLVITLGGVLPDGSSAVNDVTMLFLDALDQTRLPEPEFNLRISKCNPPEFLDRASELTISGCNNVSYYNDDLFTESLTGIGLAPEIAREYGFDLCQDVNIPGKGDFYAAADISMTRLLMDLLLEKDDFDSFEELLCAYKARVAAKLEQQITNFRLGQQLVFLWRDEKYEEYYAAISEGKIPQHWNGRTPLAPLPYLSALYHGSLEQALDLVFEPYPVKEKGMMLATPTEAVNSLAAIRKVVYDTKQYTLKQVVDACRHDFAEEGEELLRNLLWNAPKWANDDDYADSIAKEVFEFALKEAGKYETLSGGKILGGIHQPHPVPSGKNIMATPEGRHAGKPVAVTLTPESGTMKNGPTAALSSAAKIDWHLIQWNFCIMVNYYASVFRGNGGKDVFQKLLRGYFAQGGMQHQPNVLDVAELRDAQLHPEKYRDLIVRLWECLRILWSCPKNCRMK